MTPVGIDPPARSRPKTPAAAAKRGAPGRKSDVGDAEIKVKGNRATDRQRTVLSDVLGECKAQDCSRRVMVATVMCVTQESNAGIADLTGGGTDDIGPFNQGREWISAANSKSPAKATRAFLLGGEANVGGTEHSKKGWKQHHGSLKNADGGLPQLIHAVQGNARAGDYAPWEAEATRTVAAFTGGTFGDSATGGKSYTAQYLFERGSKDGQRESSWDASGRLAEEVGARRWAAINTLNYATEDELMAAAPSLQIDGDEAWVLGPPSWTWGVDRPIAELTYRVLSERWGVLPGAVVIVASQGALAGRYLVATVTDDLFSPESEVVLRRPVVSQPEPRSETRTSDTTGDTGTDADATKVGRVYSEAVAISEKNLPYVWGGGHSHVGTPDGGTGRDPGVGYDCSGYTAACLAAGGLGFTRGKPGQGSGEMASSWGQAGEGQHLTLWANATHVFLQFKLSGKSGKWADTSRAAAPPATSGPHVRTGNRSTAGFTARHWPGT